MSQPPLHPLPTVVPPPPGGIVPEASTALPHLQPAATDLQGYAAAAQTAPTAIPVQPMSMQAHIQAQIQFQAQMQAQAQQAQLLQTAQLQAQLQAQAQLRALAFMQQAPPAPPAPVPKAPVTPAPPRGWGKGHQAAPPRPGQRPLSAAQRAIRDGDFQVQRQAGLKAAEQVQEAYELATWAQKQLARASQQAELVLEKATQSQEYQQQSRAAAPSERSLEVQQQQVWMQQLSNELFNEAASIGDQILAQAESAVGTAKSAVAKVVAACEPLQALARQREEAMRVSKAQQLAQQADQRCSANLPAVERCRERLQAARDDRDRAVLIAACQQVKITVAESTGSSTFIFQAVQLAQQAAPASRTETGDGSTDGSGFYSFASSKAMVSSAVQKPLPGPEREVLPIDEHRDEIVRTIRERRVTCIQGETGCGKSSRVPQYVYHLCRPAPKRSGDPERLIVCTQPRRLAAISLAQRVAKEMGESNVGGLVGFRIAGESAFDTRRTRLLFVTAGYLLQVLVHDPGQIHRYSHVILDEAHERSVDADLLSLVLKLQLQHKLADFKIVIMSATLQGGIFSRYFQDEGDRTSPPAPIFVGVKRYHLDTLYLDELAALKTRVDPQDLAATTLEELRQRTGLGLTGPALDALNAGLDNFRTAAGAAQRRAMEAGGEPSEPGVVAMKPQLQRGFPHLLLELVRILGLGGEGILIFLPGMEEISEVFDVLEVLEQPLQEQSATGSHQPPRKSACEFKIFSLHGTIPIDEQEQAFSPPSENVCHIFLASSIAESSVTLPKVRVVIDACLRRQLAAGRSEHGVRCLLTQWVSHAAASQRSGRAGRVFPGVAIRLVPRSFYMQQMAQYDPPEIEQAPLEKLYLNVKQLSHRFSELLPRLGALPARRLLQLTVQPPPGDRLEDAVCTLVELGALTSRRDEQARITILGRMAIVLPLDLRLCRLVLFGALFGCAADAVVMAAALSGQDPFSSPMHMVIKDHLKYARALAKSFESRWHFDGGALSEPIMLRNLFKAWLKGLSQEGEGTLGSRLRVQLGASQRSMLLKHSQEFAKDHAVMPKRLTHLALTVVEIAQRTLEFLAPNTPEPTDGHLPSPSRRRLEALLAALGVQPPLLVKDANAAAEPQALKLDDVFSEDQLLLQATLTASFAPFYAHGITRCMDYTSALKGPQTSRRVSKSLDESKESTEDQAEAQVVMLKADPQIAKVHGQALTKADVLEPKSFFILPQIPDALAQQPTTDSLSFSLRELSTAGGAKFKKLFVHQGQAYLTFDGKPEDDAASEDSIDEEICPPESLVKEVQERLQLPSLEELEDEERRRKRSQPSSSSESAKRRKRRREEEEAAKSERAASKGGKGADAAGKGQASSKGKGEWQWSTVAKRDESDNEAEKDNRDDAKEAERDKEKERRKEKEKERRKEKEKEKEREKDKEKAKKEKARKTKAKKKREEESYSYSSSSDESRSRRRKKKKKEVKKKKKAQEKKKKRKDGDCLLEIGSSSSGDLEIVAETSGPILALANSTPPEPPTMETAFEEVTDEQREKQRRRLERFRAMQAGLTEGEGEGETKEASTRLEVKASDGDSVLAKLRAQADKTEEKDEKAEGQAAEDDKSATSEGEDEGEEGGGKASPAAKAEKGEKTAAEEESAEEPARSKEDEATEPNGEDSATSSPAVQSKEQKDEEKKAAAPSGEAGEGDEEVGSPVDVNEPDLKWERKTKTKAPKPGDRKRGVQFGGASQVETEKGNEGSEDGSETELFQDLKATKATEATEAETPAVPAPEDDFANFLDEIKELDALTGPESSADKMEELLQSEEGLTFKENEPQPTKAAEANSPAQSKDGQEATTSDEKPSEEEVKEEEKKKEEATEIKDELKDEGEDAKQEAEAKEMKAEEGMKEEEEEEQVKEEVKEEDVEMKEETVGSEAKAEQTSEDAPEVEPKEEEEEVELEEAPLEKEEEKEEAAQEKDEAKEAPMKEDAKEDKAEKDDEEDEMANFLEGIEQIDEAKSKEPVHETAPEEKEDTSMEVDAGIEAPADADAEPPKPMEEEEQEEEGKDEPKEASAAPDPTEDEDMTAFLQGIEQIEEQKPDDADRSSDGKADDSTILESGEGTPCGTEGGATESAEDDFAAFLGALDDMEEKKDGKAEEEAAEEGDGLDDLPAVEIKRRLRAEGVAIPKGPEDKEELVTLLRETLNKPKGDAFMDFLSEIDKIQPAADVEMKEAAPEESAFADFLKEIDGMPTAEATPAPPKKTERPLTIRYDAEGRKWVVFVAPDKEFEEFPAQASPVRARRQALDFCRTALLEMEKRGEVDKLEDEDHKSELAKILEEIKARPSRKTLLRGLDFNCLHLLVQYANGKSSFHWPVKVRQALGNRHAQSYTAEVEQKFELHRPIHPFQLAWRVCLDRRAGMSTFGTGNFRNPAGLVVSCPSRKSYVRLQKHQAKQAIEIAAAQRKLQQEQQQRLEDLLATASGEDEIAAITKKVAAETKAALAAQEGQLCSYTRFTRRLERLAVFAGAQGREDNSSQVQLEGLTVLPNVDGSNALPVLLLLAFFRPRTCGGIFSGGCSALCDLDSLQVRAISLFGRSEESRWVLPITGRQKLTLSDLQHVNTLRQAVSTAFEVDDDAAGKEQGKDRKDSAKPGARPRGRRIYIKEDAETTRALGLLLGSVGGGRCPFDVKESPASSSDAKGKAGGSQGGSAATKAVEEAKADASKASKDVSADGKKGRLLGDVWIDIAEEGAAEEALGERDFLRDPAPGGAASGVFLSFEDLGKETADPAADAAMPSPEAPPTPGKAEAGDAPRFAFLPELSLSQALKERADSFLAMQTEVREFLTTGRPDVKAANDRVRKLRKNAKWLDTFKDKSSFAWTQAMNAEEPMQVKQAMGAATRIMQELSAAFAEVEVASGFVKDLFQMSEGRLQRAESCNKLAPHIWANAVRATRLMHEKLTMQWRMAAAILKHADASKRVSYKKADETVRLVNEKLLRWKEEAEILQQEAREDEMARQAALRMGAPRPSPLEVERQHADMARQRQELERQRMQAIQWGRHLVQPIPQMQFLPPKSAAAKAYAAREESARSASPSEEWSRVPPPSTSTSEVPPPPGDQPAWAPQPPGPPQ